VPRRNRTLQKGFLSPGGGQLGLEDEAVQHLNDAEAQETKIKVAAVATVRCGASKWEAVPAFSSQNLQLLEQVAEKLSIQQPEQDGQMIMGASSRTSCSIAFGASRILKISAATPGGVWRQRQIPESLKKPGRSPRRRLSYLAIRGKGWR
jgi:hypothetical protein